MTKNEAEDFAINKIVLREGWPIPATDLYLHDYDTWIIVDGEPRKGRVQLSDGRLYYVTLDFRIVGRNGLYPDRKAAKRAIKKPPKQVG